jgi:hypothetical protein
MLVPSSFNWVVAALKKHRKRNHPKCVMVGVSTIAEKPS